LKRGVSHFTDVATALDIGEDTARKTLNRMADDGQVNRVGPGEYEAATPAAPRIIPFCPDTNTVLTVLDVQDKKDSQDIQDKKDKDNKDTTTTGRLQRVGGVWA
jgi:hypothetical protein